MKKKSLKYIGIICGLLIVVLGIFAFTQRDNIESYLMSKQYTSQELNQKLDDEKADIHKMLAQYLPEGLRDLTAEEEFSIVSGKMTTNEAKAAMGITDGEESTEVGNSTDKEAQTAAIISKYTSQLYGVKASFLGQLGSIASAAESEFYSLPAGERNSSAKASIISKYIGRASSLESSCDSQVSSILAAMRSELGAIGADTSVVGKLQSNYESQKAIEKAYYLSQY